MSGIQMTPAIAEFAAECSPMSSLSGLASRRAGSLSIDQSGFGHTRLLPNGQCGGVRVSAWPAVPVRLYVGAQIEKSRGMATARSPSLRVGCCCAVGVRAPRCRWL